MMRRLWCTAARIAAIAALASACDRVVDLTPVRDAQAPLDAAFFDDGGFVPDALPPDGFPLRDAPPPPDALRLPDAFPLADALAPPNTPPLPDALPPSDALAPPDTVAPPDGRPPPDAHVPPDALAPPAALAPRDALPSPDARAPLDGFAGMALPAHRQRRL
jgi:hypothetical protein